MSHIATPDNAWLCVKDWETGSPVILIHGWPLSSDTWDDQGMAHSSTSERFELGDSKPIPGVPAA